LVAVGLTAAKPLASAIGGKLRKNEKDLIESSFLEAIAETRREQRRLEKGKDAEGSVLHKGWGKFASKLPSVGSGKGLTKQCSSMGSNILARCDGWPSN
jgi:hypothetical protein